MTLTERLHEKISQACYNHGLFHEHSLYTRKRLVSYTIILVFQHYHVKFLGSLRARCSCTPVLTGQRAWSMCTPRRRLALLSSSSCDSLHQAYLYFTCKVQKAKSKWGLALATKVTVLRSLLTSVGLCTLFGLMPTLNSCEVFPYLVVITGLKNMLVLTKSVVSTPKDLKMKLCTAQGLSRESWSIRKTMVTKLGIILIGYFTLMPATQEFLLLCHCGPGV